MTDRNFTQLFRPARGLTRVGVLISTLLAAACTGGGAQPARAPESSGAAESKPAEPLRLKLLPAPAGVAAAPASCAQYTAVAVAGCSAGGALTSQLSQALQVSNGPDRDRALAQLEACPGFAPGLIRALRSELVPTECADVLVEDYFATTQQPPRADLKDVLFGLGIASRLERVTLQAPAPGNATETRDAFMQYFQAQLVPYIVQQATAIHELMQQAARLHGYGRGVAAIAAGTADLRFVELTRQLPVPMQFVQDPELRDAYYGALDQALEPRKARGRDAALVGMKEFASVGILVDARLERARQLLSAQYAGRRVDLLDDLLLPPAAEQSGAGEQAQLLTLLPSYYVADVLPEVELSDAEVLRALHERGLPARYRTQLRSLALNEAGREGYAGLLFELGRKYWRVEDFNECAQVAGFLPPGKTATSEALQLFHALSSALQGGPQDVAEMMLKGPFLSGGGPRVEALDAIATQKKHPFAGVAAFDAALLLSLAPPTDGALAFWQRLEARYRGAAGQLSDAALKKEALERAQAAAQTAKTLGKK